MQIHLIHELTRQKTFPLIPCIVELGAPLPGTTKLCSHTRSSYLNHEEGDAKGRAHNFSK